MRVLQLHKNNHGIRTATQLLVDLHQNIQMQVSMLGAQPSWCDHGL
jgi:hypothetical protein